MGYSIITEGETPLDEGIAVQAAQVLAAAYPGHPWHVDVKGGAIVIKLMNISRKYGEIKHTKNIYSASDMKRAVLLCGGEFLERAGLTRGALKEGEYKRIVDGIPTKDLLIG